MDFLFKYKNYSGDLNSELVRYSNGPKQFTRRMVCYSSHDLNGKLKVRYSGHRTITWHLNRKQVKVRYSDVRYSDPNCNFILIKFNFFFSIGCVLVILQIKCRSVGQSYLFYPSSLDWLILVLFCVLIVFWSKFPMALF